MNKLNTFRRRETGRRFFLVVAFVALFPCVLLAQAHERWDVKTCADAAADKIKDTVITTTVDSQFNLPIHPKGWWHINLQRQPDEMQRLELTGVVTRIAHESDGDIHLVLSSTNGAHMNIEVPDPNGISSSSRFTTEIRSARREVNAVTVGKTVRVEGIGFWDRRHGGSSSPYEAPNGREIHPVLAVTILK